MTINTHIIFFGLREKKCVLRVSIKNKGYTERSITWPQHVNKGKLNKCTLNTSVDTIFCLTQRIAGHNNDLHRSMLKTGICWTHWILDICLVVLFNCMGGVMVSVLASSAVDCGFKPWSGQTKDYNIGICCFSAKHAALRRKSKDWLARNQDNVFEWGDMSIHGLSFQWAITIKIQLSVLV